MLLNDDCHSCKQLLLLIAWRVMSIQDLITPQFSALAFLPFSPITPCQKMAQRSSGIVLAGAAAGKPAMS